MTQQTVHHTTHVTKPLAAIPLAVHTPRRSRLVLIGEEQKPSHQPSNLMGARTPILINGQWHPMRGKSVSFEQVLRIAFPHQALQNPGAATVAYHSTSNHRLAGILAPGDAVPLSQGLVFQAVATNAS